MKRKLIYSFFYALTIIICLSSCKVKTDPPAIEPPSSTSEKVYGDGIVTYMAYDDYIKNGDFGTLLSDIYTKIALYDGTEIKYGENPNQAEHEIVLGDTQKQITRDARALLDGYIDKAISSADDADEARFDTAGYSIYASGNSVAVVWSRPEIAKIAIQYFIDNYLSNPSLELEDGYIHSEILSYLEVLEERDEKQKEKEWAAVENVLGSAATQALKNHYSIFNEDFYYWLADLYDPVIGGFYFSNSARNSEGYLPDIESTAQALIFLDESGMTASYGGYTYALGGEIGEAIVGFAKSLQSSQNGYFYHPQWEGLDYTDARLARDADWAVRVVKAYYGYFAEPYRMELSKQGYSTSEIEKKLKEIPELQKYMLLYDTPNGYKGLLGAPGIESVNASEKNLTARLRDSSVSAVSKVIGVASDAYRFTPQLRSLEAWRAYLYGGTVTDVVTGKPVKFEGFDIKNSASYVTGNTISAQAAQIKERDSLAKANGEPSGYAEITKKFFDDGVNPQNGTWGDAVTYGSVNGLMKIGQLYNTMGWELRYPDKAIESSMEIVMTTADSEGVEALASTYVYNPWVAIQYIFTNVSNYNKTINKSEFSSKYRKYITANAEAMIAATTKKTAQFARDDGSFGYYVTTPCTYSQGMPVAMPGVWEGDVNGATIACTGIITNMAKALGIESVTPPVYHSADMEKFIRRMNGLGKIIKDELVTDVPPYTFEDDDISSDIGIFSGDMKEGERLIIDHNVNSSENAKMFSFTDFGKSTGSMTAFPAQGVLGTLAQSFVLDFDVYFEDINANSYIQLKIGTGASAAYMLTLDGNADGSVSLGDSSDTDSTVAVMNSFGITIPGKEWHNLRLEYYPGTESTVKTKVYVDGVLKYISNNFFGKRSNQGKTPGTTYSGAEMYSTNGSTLTVYLDNVVAQRCVDKWETEYIYDPDRIKDFEKNELDGEMPAGIIASNSQISLDPLDKSNKVLKLPSAEGSVIASTTTRLNPNSTFVFDTALYVSECEIGEIAKIYMNSGSTMNSIYALSMQAIADGDGIRIAFYPVTADGVVSNELLCTAPVGEWFNLRIEYYRYQYSVDYSEIQSIIYINGKEAGRSTRYYSFYNIAHLYKNLSFVKTSLPSTVYMDDVIAENDNITFKDSDGRTVYDPASPIFPSGGSGSTVKPDEDYNGRIDFNDHGAGVPKIPGLTTDPNSSEYGNSMEIAPSPEKENDNALLVNTKTTVISGKANAFSVIPYVSGDDANCAVLEWDMYIVSGHSPAYQIKIGNCFLFTVNSTGGLYVLTKQDEPTDGSGRRFYSMGLTLDFDEWHNIRVEYYHGTAETVKIKFYIDGKLRYECSDFAGKGTNVVGTPSGLYDDTHPAMFYSTRSSASQIYFDNIIAEKIVKEYEKEEIWTQTFETTGARGEGAYANDELYKEHVETYQDFTSAGNSTFTPGQWGWAKNWEKLLADSHGKYLNIGKKNGELNPSPGFKVNAVEDLTGKGYRLVFESDFMWGGTSEAMRGKQIGFIRFYSGGTVVHGINVYATEDGSLSFNGATFAVRHWQNLRFEVLSTDGATYLVMYVNNTEVTRTAVDASVKDSDKVAIEMRLGSILGVTGDDNYLDFSLDNTFVARIWDGTVTEPTEPDDPDGEDEETEVTPPITSEETAEGGIPSDEDVNDDWIAT